MTTKNFSDRILQLIALANQALANVINPVGMGTRYVSGEHYQAFRSSSLSFIKNTYGTDHPYYQDFDKQVSNQYPSSVEHGKGILNSIKAEIDGGWFITIKGLISAEIFADFLEMSDYLLKEKFKDAAAVMIGSVLEEHLRQLCIKHGTPIIDVNSKPKKADLMNAELSNTGVYNKLDQKSVTAIFDLRNKAAHGKYSEYNQQQVELMLQTVTEFMTRNSV